MRFRLFGDLDCPDWILAEINSMARMSSIKMKLLSQQIAKSILTGDMDYEKVKKLTADAKFDAGDTKACVAALSHILTSSSRYGVDEETLNNELQQLGLPKEHAIALCKAHNENTVAITARLGEDSLRLSRLEDVQWRVDVVANSSRQVSDESQGGPQPEVQIGLVVKDSVNNARSTHLVGLSPTQLALLITELKKATSIMESLE